MANHGADDAEDLVATWHSRGDAEKLFDALRDAMRQAARRGIRRILGGDPDEADVEDVVLKAFKEFLKAYRKAPVSSPLGLAKVIADRRGRDRARSIRREREGIKDQTWVLDQLLVSRADAEAAARREQLGREAMDCMDTLTADQRDVIEATILRLGSLSDWVAARGTSYQAGDQLRARGLSALRRCLETRRAANENRSPNA